MESVGEIDLRVSVRSLCLCGECFSSNFHHRDTEIFAEAQRNAFSRQTLWGDEGLGLIVR